jgi:hypothetical protein
MITVPLATPTRDEDSKTPHSEFIDVASEAFQPMRSERIPSDD